MKQLGTETGTGAARSRSPSLQRILRSPQLPSVPAVALRLLELARDPDSSTDEIVQIIKSDPALTVKILRSANSSYFGFRAQINTLERAVPLLGRTAVTSLALSFSLSAEAMHDNDLARHYRGYWLRSLVQAAAAETLSRFGLHGMRGELFMVGLLIDVGQLAMLKVLHGEYAQVLEAHELSDAELCEIEVQRLGFHHVEVGVALMNQWKLPAPMILATELHHCDPLGLPAEEAKNPLIHSMLAASAVGDYFCGGQPGAALARLRELTEQFFEFTESTLCQYLEATDARTKEAATLFSTDIDELPSPSDLMAQASEQLAEITIRQEREKQEVLSQQQLAERQRLVLESQNQRLRQQAVRDGLTSVYNRRYFDESLLMETRRAALRGQAISVLFVDADHFKEINDRHGHTLGDQVLVQLAEAITATVRNHDVVARYGGEEFVVLVSEASEAAVKSLAERIRLSAAALTIEHGGQPVSVTVSIGAAIAMPLRTEEHFGPRLLEAADAAMYESKRRGRNCATVRSMVSEFDHNVSQRVMHNRFSQWLVHRQVLDAADAHEFSHAARPAPVFVGELAIRKGWLTREQVQHILSHQADAVERFGAIAFDQGLLSAEHVAVLLAEQTEDPQRVAARLVADRILDPAEAQGLLEAFFAERLRRLENDPSSPSADGQIDRATAEAQPALDAPPHSTPAPAPSGLKGLWARWFGR